MSANFSLSPRWALLSIIMVALAIFIAPSASPAPPDQKPNPSNGNGGGHNGGGQNPAPPGQSSGSGNGAQPGATPSDAPSSQLEPYIVVLKSGAGDPSAIAVEHAERLGAQVSHVYDSALKGYAAKIPVNRVDAVRADSRVRFVTPDSEVQIAGQMVGTGVQRIKAASKPDKGAGVNVAVIDTGIDTNHPDIAANIVGGTNCSKGGPRNYDDGNGHGTHVAGIIAALDNGIGVVGVAPEAKLWAVRVLNDQGFGWTSDVICGVDFVDSKSPAKGGPITVANMSLGGWGSDDGNCGNTNGDPWHQATCRAVSDGVTFVVAAGNAGVDLSQSLSFVPAAYDEVITVSALADSTGTPCGGGGATPYGPDDTFASFSNYATSAADLNHLVAAPGVNIYSTYKGGAYATLSGTSMASPHVAGSAALYVAAHPGASPASVREGLKAMGEPVDVSFNGECGTSTTTGKKQGGHHASHTDPSGRHPEVVLRDDSL
jgi:subtilisin